MRFAMPVASFSRSRPPRLARALLPVSLIALACVAVSEARAATFSGKTSRHGVVRVGIAKGEKLEWLIIELEARCSDKRRRTFWPGFNAPFEHPQSRSGAVGDAYNLVGRDVVTGVRFRQHAKFSARIKNGRISGTAQGTQSLLATGVVCKSPRVSFAFRT